MTDAKIAELKRKRGGIKSIITHFQNKLGRNEFQRLAEFESALQRVKSAYDNYYKYQCELEVLITDDQDEAILDKFMFEDQYGSVEAELLTLIQELKQNSNKDSKLNQYKLPKIDLPKFDGLPTSWLNFKGIFSGLVHDEIKLSDTTKFYYLISCLRGGKAYHLIEPYPIDDANYKLAWEALENHFDDKTLIQEIHVRELYEIKRPQEHNSVSLQSFIDAVSKHFMALNTIDNNLNVFNLFLFHHLVERLDNASKVEVLKKKSESHDSITFESFIEVLQNRAKILRSFKQSATSNTSNSHTNKEKGTVEHKPKVEKTFMSRPNYSSCEYCKGNHKFIDCFEFKKPDISPVKRLEIVRKLRVCTNCLDSNHKVVECQSQGCSLCSLKHNTLLHFKNNASPGTSHAHNRSNMYSSQNMTPPQDMMPTNTSHLKGSINAHSALNETDYVSGMVILPTAIVWATKEDGSIIPCRALLDSGSQSHFVTERICQLMNIKKWPTMVSISGINQKSSNVKSEVSMKIQSRVSDYETYLKFLVLPSITSDLPSNYVPVNKDKILHSVTLADPWFYKPNCIDMILGAEIFNEIISNEKVVLFKEMPPFVNTSFGFVIAGKYSPLKLESPINVNRNISNESSNFICTLQQLNTQIQRFWDIESVKSDRNYSIEERLCEEHFVDNVSRDATGRYCTSFPFNNKIKTIGETSFAAMAQFKTLESKLKRNPELQAQYIEFINEYIELQHMEEVPDPNIITNLYGKSFYLPHHCVLREKSSTTKLRVVFNASQKSSNGVSLNDCLLVGPTIQQDLWSIILRFRKHPIAFCADITKMYRQIRIENSDSDFQRIFWRESSEKEIRCYKLKTVTYGTASAPFSAIRTLHQLADDEKDSYKEASIILKRDFYVDDVLTGANTCKEAVKLKNDLVRLLQKGGFELRKFVSNDKSISSTENECKNQKVSVLGLQWDYVNDRFHMHFDQFEVNEKKAYTKRVVLSEIARLFDPLGICAPMIFIAKLFMQTLWSHTELSWDTELPSNLREYWVDFKSQLMALKMISFPREIGLQKLKRIELHGFGDASEKGYGCVIYVRIIHLDDSITLRLLNARSRVAPLKRQTIPRLELCAALLLTELMEKTLGIMEIKFQSLYYWSDSEITLLRIKSEPSKFVIFVANRLSQIQELSSPNDWHFVPSEMNPADLVSRGVMPEQFVESDLWWNGPQFLYWDRELWPKPSASKISEHIEYELRKTQTVMVSRIENWNIFAKYSSVIKLLRITALCKRFINNCRLGFGNRISGKLTTQEIDSGLRGLIKIIQFSEFGDEIKDLRKSQIVSPRSRLKSLSPFLDAEDLLRVGGRLHHANIPYDSQHQFILPASHIFTELLARCEHERLLHCGPQALLYALRLKYWIIGGRNLCRQVVRKCIKCFRVRPKIVTQIMGDLPSSRANPSRPFAITGVDFCGPFNICHQLRKKIIIKIYVALFICFSTKSVHMEIVDSLSTQSFIATLRRFVSRRGLCSHIYSDNATNFVGSKAELIELQKLFSAESHQRQVDQFCSSNGMQWHTIPARSPHFGGLWEAAVKSAKHHLKCTLGQTSFVYENFQTIIVQIEACLNSRPLSPMSSDPSDMTCLTPGHFLIGQPLTELPDPSLEHLAYSKLSQYQRIQYLLQQFWKRWSKEYLLQLQHRRKWLEPTDQFKIGSLVLLHDDCSPPMKWNLGRIAKTFVGNDNKVRVVLVKTSTGELKRAVTKISVLPIEV